MLPQKSGKARQRRDRFARVWLLRAALTASLPILVLGTCARAEEASENQVKAAYLFNFAKSAQWPSALLADGTAPLIIGVFGGDDEFVDILKGMVAEKTIGSHPIAVKHLNAGGDLKGCQMIFFRASERRATRATIAAIFSWWARTQHSCAMEA
jgi:YfiR/HmsC-like